MSWGNSDFTFGTQAHKDKPISHEVRMKQKQKEHEEIEKLTAIFLEKKPITVIPYGVRRDLPKADFKKH